MGFIFYAGFLNPLFFKIKMSGHKNRSIKPSISIIIPAYNEEKYILKTLNSLKKQSYKNFETIVVANDCSDNTIKIAKGDCDLMIDTKIKGVCFARNLGAKKSKGEILIFLDADTRLSYLSLEKIEKVFSDKNYVIGTVKGKPNVNDWLCSLLYMYKNFVHKYKIHMGSSGIIICRKRIFKKTTGFEQEWSPKEIGRFIKKINKFGDYVYIDSIIATTSMRRFKKQNFLKAVFFWVNLQISSLFTNLSKPEYKEVR